jgi:putative endonuclease
MVYLYVIRSREHRKRYVGIAADIGLRLREHARGGTKGGQQLGRFELIHRETFSSYAEARKREKFLKSGQGRRWLDERFGQMATADRR